MKKKETKKRKKEEERFIEGLKKRGELVDRTAKRKDTADDLPPGATHEIVGYDKDGNPIVKRRRFSAS